MCTSHQPGSVTRFHMAIVAIMVLLLIVTAVITGTCSISSEGNLLRHTAPPPAHTVSQEASPMAGCQPGCPMHHTPASRRHHSGAPACIVCDAPAPATLAATLPLFPATVDFVAVSFPGLASALPPAPALASPNPPPTAPPLSARPASLRV